MRRLALVAPCIVSLTGCPSDSESDGTGTADSTSATDPTSSPTTSATMSTTVSATDTDPTTGATTMVDPDTTVGESSTTDTGVGECPYTVIEGGEPPAVGLQLVANGFVKPVIAIGDPDQPDRLFVADQTGFIKILEPGMTTAPDDTFLEVDSAGFGNAFISSETGLLGFALHPDFPDTPLVYVAYSPGGLGGSPPTRVSEFSLVDGDPNHADPASERIVIEAAQPASNHNGGMIAFGPDGYLYVGFGDGGNGDDQPQQTGRNTGVILSKMLRIDPEPDGTPDPAYDDCGNAQCDNVSDIDFDYTIPADNPFLDDNNFAPEIYAWGFRNPWRFSFDPDNGDLYVADVGQNAYEEVSIVVAGGDYGWSDMEGFHCFNGGCDEVDTPNAVNADGMTMPITEYSHDGGRCSITGGGVYRSCEVPAWDGLYVYGDVCSQELMAAAWDGTMTQNFDAVLSVNESILGNGWNAWGDVYITTAVGSYGTPSSDGKVYRVAPAG